MALRQALTGVHVLEVATYLPGPACTQILAGLGARVTKVSRLGGDPLRELAPLDATYDLFNAGKTELELDLKAPEGAATLRELADACDRGAAAHWRWANEDAVGHRKEWCVAYSRALRC